MSLTIASPLATHPVSAVEASSPRPGGNTVYFGRVYPLEGPHDVPTYVYERTVVDVPGGRVSTHVTRDSSGAVQLDESARHSLDYGLADYVMRADQAGQSGSIDVDGDRVAFRKVGADGRVRTRTERVREPVAVGPTLVGFIARHLAHVRSGSDVRVRLAILGRLETIGFRLAAERATDEETVVRMSPTSLLLSLFIRPVRFTFDARGRLTELEGRVPTKLRRKGRLHDFDARVVYEYALPAYR